MGFQPCSQPFQLPALQCCSDNTTHICTFAHTNLSSLLSPMLPCAWNLLPPPDSYTFMLLSDSQPCHLISVWVSPDHREEMQKLLWHQQLFFDFLQTRKLGTSANSAQQKLLQGSLPFWNCAEANLVKRMPAPSIKARRIPPIAADPTMATGPSKNKSTEQHLFLFLLHYFARYSSLSIVIISPMGKHCIH